METTNETNIKDLIHSEEFEDALLKGANYKKEIVTTYKSKNKDVYKRFQEIMYENNPEIKELLAKRRKNRTDIDNARLKDYKRYVSTLYRQTQELISNNTVEEGQKTKIEKIVSKIIPVINMLKYIDCDILEKEFEKYGAQLIISPIENTVLGLNDSNLKQQIKEIFAEAQEIREKVHSDNEYIEQFIFIEDVPQKLQYDKNVNNAGLKSSDFKKLVDIKTKLLIANTEEAKEKVEEKIEHIATEKQFEAARAELVRDSLESMQ